MDRLKQLFLFVLLLAAIHYIGISLFRYGQFEDIHFAKKVLRLINGVLFLLGVLLIYRTPEKK